MRRRISKLSVLSLILLAGLLLASCAPAAQPAPAPAPTRPAAPSPAPATPAAPAPAPAKPRDIIEVGGLFGSVGSVTITQGMVLAKMLKDYSPFLRMTPIPTEGYAKGVEYWDKTQGKGHYALAFTTTMMTEYAQGVRTYAKQGPRSDLSLLWVVNQLDYFSVAKKSTGIETSEQLKNALKSGTKVGLGTPGTTSYIITKAYLEDGLGLQPTEYNAVYAAINDLIGLYKEGTVDIAMWGHIGSKGLPYPYLENMTSGGGVSNFIPHSQAEVDRMNKSLGGSIYSLDTAPAGLYRGMTKDTPWVSGATFLALPKAYPDDIAYEMARVWWDRHDEGIDINPLVAHSDIGKNKIAVKGKWEFPYHTGAVKFYKERGWL
ncbi:MAG: TAXI family TRAP transporter solute-binding subunit [Chloroflexota bacterium]